MPRPATLAKRAVEDRVRLHDIYRAELARRARVREGLTRYFDLPVEFIAEICGDHLWSKQAEIARAVALHRKVAVASAHGIGKSFLAARVVAWFIASSPPGVARAVTTAPTGDQVRGILWHEINSAHARGRLPGRTSQLEWWIEGYQVAVGRKPADYSPTAFQGYHADRLLVLIDEACGVPENIWTAADSLATTDNSRMLAIGNPDDPGSHFAQICKPGSGWYVLNISVFDSPNFTGEAVPDHVRRLLTGQAWVDDKRRIWGEDSPLWTSKVMGEFPEVGDDTLIAPGWIRRAVNQYRDTEASGDIELGCDIARFGSAETVIMARQGKRAWIHKTLRNRDLMHVTGQIVRAIKDLGAARVKIDDAGLGGGVTDRLEELYSQGEFGFQAVEIMPINVGVSPSDNDDRRERGESSRFYNLRAELSWHLRTLFENDEIALEADDDLEGQIVSIRYQMTSRGQIQIEGKDKMAARGLPSPDRFDALVLACAPTQPRSLRAWEGML